MGKTQITAQTMKNKAEKAERDNGIVLKCPGCKRIWVYKGKSDYRATCPSCLGKAYIDRNALSEDYRCN